MMETLIWIIKFIFVEINYLSIYIQVLDLLVYHVDSRNLKLQVRIQLDWIILLVLIYMTYQLIYLRSEMQIFCLHVQTTNTKQLFHFMNGSLKRLQIGDKQSCTFIFVQDRQQQFKQNHLYTVKSKKNENWSWMIMNKNNFLLNIFNKIAKEKISTWIANVFVCLCVCFIVSLLEWTLSKGNLSWVNEWNRKIKKKQK